MWRIESHHTVSAEQHQVPRTQNGSRVNSCHSWISKKRSSGVKSCVHTHTLPATVRVKHGSVCTVCAGTRIRWQTSEWQNKTDWLTVRLIVSSKSKNTANVSKKLIGFPCCETTSMAIGGLCPFWGMNDQPRGKQSKRWIANECQNYHLRIDAKICTNTNTWEKDNLCANKKAPGTFLPERKQSNIYFCTLQTRDKIQSMCAVCTAPSSGDPVDIESNEAHQLTERSQRSFSRFRIILFLRYRGILRCGKRFLVKIRAVSFTVISRKLNSWSDAS